MPTPGNGIGIYVACPTPISVTSTIKTPSYCSTGNYYSGSACAVFNSQTVQPQFGDMGYIGRSTQKATHWSSTHVPLEAVSQDPLPAECGDMEAHQCTNSYSGQQRYSVYDIQKLTNAGTTVTYASGTSAGQTVNVSLDSYNGHVQPQGSSGLWHQHAWPSWDNGSYADYVVGYALDGTPIMGKNSIENTSGTVARSRYSLKSGQDGRYAFDYEYSSSNSGNLDEFNGGYATINNVSQYAYFVTETYPYIVRNYHGST